MAFDAGAVIAKLELNIQGWQKSVEAVKKDQQSLAGLVMRHEQQFKSLGKTLTVVGGLMVASLGALVKKTADYGDEMDELHQRTGASVELLTGLDGALRKNGASTEDLATGMKFLSGKMVDANNGNKAAIDLFNGLEISVTDANGKLRSTTDVLFDVATRFKGMENGAVKTTSAVDLLGRGGMSLIPTLNLGADGLKRETEEAGRLGKVLTVETAKACSDFNDSLVDLKGGLQGVGIQIGTALMPAVKGLVEKITGIIIKVREWAAEHPELASGLSKVALGLGALMMTIGPVLYALPGLIKGLTALKAIAAGPIAIIVTVGIIAAIKAMSDFKSEFNNMRDAMKESGSSGFEAFLEGVNSGWRRVALGMKDSNIILSEANALARLYATEGGRGVKDMLLEEKGALDGLNPALSALAALLKDVGIKTKTELTEELKKAEEALSLLKTSAEATPGSIKALEDQIAKLKEQITGVTVEARSLAEQLGITFRSDIEAQIKKLNEALVTYRGKLTADEIQRICTEINTLQGRLTALKGPVIDLAQAFQTVMSSMDNLPATTEEIAVAINAEFKDLAEEMQADFEKLAMKDLPAYLQNIPAASEDVADKTKSVWQECSTVISDSMKEIASAVADLFNFKGLFGAMPEMPKFDSSYFNAMVAAANTAFDAVKAAIESSIDAVRSALDKELSGIKSYYDKLEEVAKSAYDKVADAAKASFDKAEESARAAFDKIEENVKAAYDALEEAARAAYDAVEARISRQQSIEDRARSWHDTFEDRAISRQQEREDRAFGRQYEKEREAIENSKMTRAEKDAALAALARKFEHEQDVREMKRQHEADVRQRAREHADLVRELARERAKEARERAYNKAKEAREQAYDKAREARERAYDKAKEARERAYERAKEARERAFQLKLEGIRAAQAAAEAAARTVAAAAEAKLLRDLLTLQNAHQVDLDGIRIKEDLARQKQTDDEEKRQGSLWFKVKGIFAQACTSMATIFLTEMLKPVGSMIADLAKKILSKGKDGVVGALEGAGKGVKGLGETIGGFISGIGAGIGGFISGLATGVGAAVLSIATAIGGAIVALATGIATAAGILVAALPDLMLIAGAALAIYAGFTIVKGLVDKIFGKKMDTGGMEYWLKLMWELSQNSYNFLVGPLTWFMNEVKNAVTTEIVPTLWNINNGIGAAVKALYHISTKVDTSTGYLRSTVEYLKTIAEKISSMTSIAAGAVSYRPSMAIARGTPSLAGVVGGGGQGPINLTIPFYLDGKLLDERMLRIANGRVKWLDQQYQHSNKLIPARSIGGAG